MFSRVLLRCMPSSLYTPLVVYNSVLVWAHNKHLFAQSMYDYKSRTEFNTVLIRFVRCVHQSLRDCMLHA